MAKKAKRRAKKTAAKKTRKAAKSKKPARKAKKSKKRAPAKKPTKTRKAARRVRQPIPMPEQLAPSGMPELVPSALEQE